MHEHCTLINDNEGMLIINVDRLSLLTLSTFNVLEKIP